jgi:hypothetical protein
MSSKDIIDHLYNGDLDQMREAFHQTMLPHVANMLETKKLEVASKMIGDGEPVSEEVLAEISKKTLGSYVKKSAENMAAGESDKETYRKYPVARKEAEKQVEKRRTGIERAVKKLTKEEMETIIDALDEETLTELSKGTLKSYVHKASMDMVKNNHLATSPFKGKGYAKNKVAERKFGNRVDGVKKAFNKVTKEEVEEFLGTLTQEEIENLQELSSKKLLQYTAKAGYDTKKDREKGIDKATKKLSKDE